MSESVITDEELRRFPRVMPENTELIDTFPLHPIPEQMTPIKADLLGQLALAHAPITSRRIACILAGADEGYGGHTIERSPTDIEDPFMMALGNVPEGAKLFGIMVTGEGVMKEKHVMPSVTAYDRIAPLLLPGSPIVVVPPNQREDCRIIPERMHQAAYSPKPASIFQGKTIFESTVEAIENTTLCMEDCEFVAHLRHTGLEDGIHYYLTGSSNGQSGASFALRPGLYRDLDIIAVSDKSKEEIEAAFESLAEAWYGKLEKVHKTVSVAGSDDMLDSCIFSNSEAGISVDFFAAPKLECAFVRPENLARNFYHQLS